MYELQLVTRKLNGQLCADRGSCRSGCLFGHARIYVLGIRMSIHPESLYHASEYLPGRSRNRGADLQHTVAYTCIAPAIKLTGGRRFCGARVTAKGARGARERNQPLRKGNSLPSLTSEYY